MESSVINLSLFDSRVPSHLGRQRGRCLMVASNDDQSAVRDSQTPTAGNYSVVKQYGTY